MIVVPASLRSDFIHMAGMTIHIALESTIHIVGIRSMELLLGRPAFSESRPVQTKLCAPSFPRKVPSIVNSSSFSLSTYGLRF